MGITKQLLQRELSASDLEIEERCDSIAIYRTITWQADSFGWEMGNQSGTHTFDAADEVRIVEFTDNTVKFRADAEYSKVWAEEFELPIPADLESKEFIKLLDTAEQWLNGSMDMKEEVAA